jgi:hypothetical protein
VIFHDLWKCFPKFIHAKALAEILKKDWDEKTQKQISDAIGVVAFLVPKFYLGNEVAERSTK